MSKIKTKMIALDCETTGLDVFHGARPFFVTVCYEDGRQDNWEWKVDPKTRRVVVPEEDKDAIRQVIDSADRVVGQNVKFDAAMLREARVIEEWPWHKTEDTLVAGHLLKSNQVHDLTTMALVYLGENIAPYEEQMKKLVVKARGWARRHRPDWRIAKAGLPEMPSAKEKTWASDMWLLQHYEDGDHADLFRAYANVDSAVTLRLWQVFEEMIRKDGLWAIYREKMKTSKVVYGMEARPVAVLRENHELLTGEYKEESEELGDKCLEIAEKHGYDLVLPKGSNNNSLKTFAFDVLGMPVVKRTKIGQPSMDKDCFDLWPLMLDPGSDQLGFIKALRGKRKRDTALGFLAAYEKFWLRPRAGSGHWDLYSSLNQTGTHTLRFSMSNPNLQQVSKQESKCPECAGEGCDSCGGSGEDLHSVRKVFGPRPGREWWCCDYENIELRIPGFEFKELAMMELFQHPNDPPYFGSYHLLNASIVYPDLFFETVCIDCAGTKKRLKDMQACRCSGKRTKLCEIKGAFKDRYNATWYQYDKNGGFAIQYGCQRAKADATFRRPGAYDLLKQKLPRMTEGNNYYVDFANRHGYVETLPDRTIGCDRGHPIWCSISGWGKISPTLPLNYHVQSTAMWCTSKAMVRCDEYLKEVTQLTGKDHYVALQVHDEIVFDFPEGGKANLGKVRRLQRLMEESGDDIGIPLKVAASYHPRNWNEKGKI